MKTIIITAIAFLISNVVNQQVFAQVKTKTYYNGVPKTSKEINYSMNEIYVSAPSKFEILKQNQSSTESSFEYTYKFAEAKVVDLDLLKTAKQNVINDNIVYSIKLIAKEALNVSLRFSEFKLSQNSLLSIESEYEITDSITSKENNEQNVWSTRVYHGNFLYLTLIIPKDEVGLTRVRVNEVNFGFKHIGGEYFGHPGESATCNINILCPQGNGWQNERSAVALVVSGSNTVGAGTLVMNTCRTNIPYFLTSEHMLDNKLSNWVFQFQTWSSTCSPNGSFREDVQFNGCQLKAKDAATDFALLQLNQTPQSNSNITYAGWSRDINNTSASATIHHPQGDLMKISLSSQPGTIIPWFGGAPNHLRVTFVAGIVQRGSSGAALFDLNHRVVGQLHGYQLDICGPGGSNECWCRTQIPSKGDYGRFAVSWTGGGTDDTRLSNWLDPSGSGAVTTNTTNVSALIDDRANIPIIGPDVFCSGVAQYNVYPPPGSTVIWSVSPSGVTSDPNPLTGNQTSLTQTGSGRVVLTASVTTCNGNSIIATKPIIVGQPPLTGTINAASSNQALYMFNNITGPNPTYVSYNWPGVSNITVTTIYSDPSASYYTYPGGFTFYLTTGGLGVRIAGNSACNGQIYLDYYFSRNYGYRMVASPNPAKGRVNVSITKITDAFSDKAQATVTASGINSKGVTKMSLYDFNTNVIVKQWTYQETETLNYDLNLTGVKAGYYVLKMERNNKVASTKILVK